MRVKVVFSPEEREIIHTYVKSCAENNKHGDNDNDGDHRGGKHGKNPKGLPPGLAKKVERGGDLPPGWQRKCVPGAVIHPDVYKRCEPLPQEVVVKLPPPPPDTIVVTIEGRVLRLARATLEILDVFEVL